MLMSANPFAGLQFGPYKFLSQLSASQTSEVWLAEDTRLQRKLVVKLLPERLATDTVRVRRFEQEAWVTAAIHHPNILSIYDHGQDGKIFYIVVEYIEGQTLQQLLKSGQVKLTDALDITRQAASALAATHGAGIVHRNLKPENIMVREDGLVKLLDFGRAKLLVLNRSANPPSALSTNRNWYLSDSATGLDTASYLSPEQAIGLDVDTRSDLFCLGVLFYEMLTGVKPFTGATITEVLTAILNSETPPLSQYIPQAPPRLEQIVSRTLRKEPAERYQTANEFLQDLDNFKLELERETPCSNNI
ncbi:MAG: serine/threonine protein kinase [Acidobacteria bacterium]|nr:serine/threonine protein kinase [Acidobacteriota bacterium]